MTLYVSGGRSGGLEVLLGAESLDQLLNRMDAVDRVTEQDTRVLREVKGFKSQVQARKLKLRRARAAQRQEVAERAAQQSTIESQLREREQMLASVREEIAQLEAEEAARQARLQARPGLASPRRRSSRRIRRPLRRRSTQLVASEPAAPVPDARYGGVVGDRDAVPRHAVRVGRRPPGGFDCSGFVMYVFSQVGVSLPHHAASQYGVGVPVSQDQLQAGDLVFFDGLGHVGIYIGGGQFIHSPHTGDVVKISSLSDSWYAATYVGARRI